MIRRALIITLLLVLAVLVADYVAFELCMSQHEREHGGHHHPGVCE